MKLKNKKTGEIIDLDIANVKAQFGGISVIPEPVVLGGDEYVYSSLAELCEEWEDYEEPKEYWMINAFGDVETVSGIYTDDMTDELREIGNYFGTKEESEKAVEKLKAWKRLKDKKVGFYISKTDFQLQEGTITFEFGKILTNEQMCTADEDLSILFGGEE